MTALRVEVPSNQTPRFGPGVITSKFSYQLLVTRYVGNLPFGDVKTFVLIVVMGTRAGPLGQSCHMSENAPLVVARSASTTQRMSTAPAAQHPVGLALLVIEFNWFVSNSTDVA